MLAQSQSSIPPYDNSKADYCDIGGSTLRYTVLISISTAIGQKTKKPLLTKRLLIFNMKTIYKMLNTSFNSSV